MELFTTSMYVLELVVALDLFSEKVILMSSILLGIIGNQATNVVANCCFLSFRFPKCRGLIEASGQLRR